MKLPLFIIFTGYNGNNIIVNLEHIITVSKPDEEISKFTCISTTVGRVDVKQSVNEVMDAIANCYSNLEQ